MEITEYILSTSRAGQPTMQRRAGMAAAVCMYGYGFGMRHRHTRRSVVVAHTHSAEWTGVAEEGVELINETRRDPLSAFLFGAGLFGLAQGRRLAGGCAVPCRDGSARDAGRYAGTDLMTTQPGLVICRRAGGQAGRRAGRALAGGGGGQAGQQQPE